MDGAFPRKGRGATWAFEAQPEGPPKANAQELLGAIQCPEGPARVVRGKPRLCSAAKLTERSAIVRIWLTTWLEHEAWSSTPRRGGTPLNTTGPTHLDERVRQEMDRIRGLVRETGRLCEIAVRRSLLALRNRDRQMAFSVILRDQRVDEMEIEIDRACLEFLVRLQPVAGPLRMAYSTIRINLELERIGDYAESIARQVLKLVNEEAEIPTEHYEQIADLSLQMLHEAIEAYMTEDGERARRTIATEDSVDELKSRINRRLVQLFRDQRIPFEVLNALMMITRRFERISDQARNICQEVVYMCTGEPARHPHSGIFRVLFADAHTATRGLMAEAIGRALSPNNFEFCSASRDPTSLELHIVRFMESKGLPVQGLLPRSLSQLENLHHFSVIVLLDPDAASALPPNLGKIIVMDWPMADPTGAAELADEREAALQQAYAFLKSHIEDLVDAVLGEDQA